MKTRLIAAASLVDAAIDLLNEAANQEQDETEKRRIQRAAIKTGKPILKIMETTRQ